MLLNIIHNTRPYIAHAAGRLDFIPLWDEMNRLVRLPTAVPPWLEVITFNSGPGQGHNGKMNGLLERQLPAATALGRGLTWRNSMKIELLHQHLAMPGPEYVLAVDSSDVFVLRPLDGLLDDFLSFGCEAVFNMEKMFWPKDMKSEFKEFEDSIGPGYLNAGVWIATRSFAAELSESLLLQLRRLNCTSEQRVYKEVFPLYHPRMQVDYRCLLFQGLNRVDGSEVAFTKWL